MSKVTAENYADMKKRIGKLSSDFDEISSTNVLPLFDALDGAGSEWIDSAWRRCVENEPSSPNVY